jgi:hypothetical protein
MSLQYCAPSKTRGKNDKTCFSTRACKKMAHSYNRKRATCEEDKISLNLSKNDMFEMLMEKLKDSCRGKDSDVCLLEQDFVKKIGDKEIHQNSLRPKKPKGKYEWLSNIDIGDVMSQYEKAHDDFIFLGPLPIDFADLFDELANINLKKFVYNKKRKIGIVFNLDPHHMSGSHWVALFANIDKNTSHISFFDSFGTDPPKEIKRFMDRLEEQCKRYNIDKNPKVNINKIAHQQKNSECGVYSINFIINLLEGKSFENVATNIVRDEKMNRLRDYYFRPHT